MKKRLKRPVLSVRKRWVINPKTKVKQSGRIYKRAKLKETEKKVLYEQKEPEA